MGKAAMLRVCSHTRSGTHLLCKLLFDNLHTGATDYEQLHYSHTRPSPDGHIHLYRALYPTALSMWRVREHLGFAESVSFHDLVTVPLEDLPTSESCSVLFNGHMSNRVCPMKARTGLLADRWTKYIRLFAQDAVLNVCYDDVVNNPLYVLCTVVRSMLVGMGPYKPVFERCGWWSAETEQPIVSAEDAYMLETVSRSVLCDLQ